MASALIICNGENKDRIQQAFSGSRVGLKLPPVFNLERAYDILTRESPGGDEIELVTLTPELNLTDDELKVGLRLIEDQHYLRFIKEPLYKNFRGLSLIGVLKSMDIPVIVTTKRPREFEGHGHVIQECMENSGLTYRVAHYDLEGSRTVEWAVDWALRDMGLKGEGAN